MRAITSFLVVHLVLSITAGVTVGREPVRERQIPVRAVQHERYLELLDPELRPAYSSAQVDTYTIVYYDFEFMKWQGWTRIDNTAQVDTFFHADDFAGLGGGDFGRLVPLEGTKSIWCGSRPDDEPYEYICHWEDAPGYGNSWDQLFVTDPIEIDSPATLSYRIVLDTEAGWDSLCVEYDKGDYAWALLAVHDGLVDEFASHDIYHNRASTKLRFHFVSDGAFGDEDGLYNTDGACIIDEITISDGSGTIDYEDFEAWEAGAHGHPGSIWRAEPAPGYGLNSRLFSGLIDKDPCGDNLGTQVVFFGLQATCPSVFYPGLYNTPFCTGPGMIQAPCQNEMIVSPIIFTDKYTTNHDDVQDADLPPEVLTGLGGAELRFTVYRDLPLENLVFYSWNMKNVDPVTLCPGQWYDRLFAYYGEDREYIRHSFDISDLIGAHPIQINLHVYDACDWWYNVYGDCWQHTPAPWFDNVEVRRYKTVGPQWLCNAENLFQDNFPEDGIGSWVRADAALDIYPGDWSAVLPGDSVVVSCFTQSFTGIREGGVTGGAEVYMHVRATDIGPEARPDLAGSQMIGTYGTYASDDGEWTVIQCDTAVSGYGNNVDGSYMVDLNDSLLTRGYMIEYYFSAIDNDDVVTTMPLGGGGSGAGAALGTGPPDMYEFTCLPTLATNILYVDDFDGIGTRKGVVQEYFEQSFRVIFGNYGIFPDRYDVNAPEKSVSNGPGGRARQEHLAYYDAIIWDSGDLDVGTIDDGGFYYPKSNDCALLNSWLLNTPHDVGLWVLGDNVATDLSNSMGMSAQELMIWCDVSLSWESFFDLTGGLLEGGIVNPVIEPVPGGILAALPDLYFNGGCPVLDDFDVIVTSWDGQYSLAYPSYEGSDYYAAIQTERPNYTGHTSRTMWFGSSLMHARDGNFSDPPAVRNEVITTVLLWFLGSLPPPVGEEVLPAYTCHLGQNFPNPFNPVTTVRFGLERREHAKVRIYDVAGRLVRVLVDEVLDAGPHEVTWEGRNSLGLEVASGVYFCRMEAGYFQDVRKLVLLR
jgi:hypothetical protein